MKIVGTEVRNWRNKFTSSSSHSGSYPSYPYGSEIFSEGTPKWCGFPPLADENCHKWVFTADLCLMTQELSQQVGAQAQLAALQLQTTLDQTSAPEITRKVEQKTTENVGLKRENMDLSMKK
jgi:hypothetical protein